jgi:hypothetical protein
MPWPTGATEEDRGGPKAMENRHSQEQSCLFCNPIIISHFMPIALLDSQFAALEEPTLDEHPVIIEVDQIPGENVTKIIFEIKERAARAESY